MKLMGRFWMVSLKFLRASCCFNCFRDLFVKVTYEFLWLSIPFRLTDESCLVSVSADEVSCLEMSLPVVPPRAGCLNCCLVISSIKDEKSEAYTRWV